MIFVTSAVLNFDIFFGCLLNSGPKFCNVLNSVSNYANMKCVYWLFSQLYSTAQ